MVIGAVRILLTAALVADLIAWAAFRLDKRWARRGQRRVRERTLLALATLGGLGALLAMYGHRQRHKVAKARFVAVAWTAALAKLAAAGWLLGR